MRPYAAAVKVRFGDIDRAGIVYYPRYFHYFHVAFEEFFADRVGVPYHVLLDEKRVGFPSVHVECDYRAPLRFGDVLQVGITVVRIGGSSVTFRYRVRARRRLVAEARVTVVSVDMDTIPPRRNPAGIRRVFERHLDAGSDSLGGARRIG
jgi:4-hydroxybenzoyl-CoA thioesterase